METSSIHANNYILANRAQIMDRRKMTDSNLDISDSFKTLRRRATIKNVISAMLGLLLLGGIAWVIVEAIQWLISLFSGIQKEVAVGIIAATATVTVSLVSVVFGRINERKKMAEQDIRNKKTAIYEELISSFMHFTLSHSEFGKARPEKFGDAEEKLLDIWLTSIPKMMIWASDDVLSKWSEFRSSSMSMPPGPVGVATMLYMTEDLILTIRKDLGHKNNQLARGSILRLFINDIPK